MLSFLYVDVNCSCCLCDFKESGFIAFIGEPWITGLCSSHVLEFHNIPFYIVIVYFRAVSIK